MSIITQETALLLGIVQNNSGSELQTGARAELDPTPVNKAMASLKSLLMAQVMKRIITHPGAHNYILARLAVIHEVVRRNVKPDAVMVDVAAGFAPLSLAIANEMPDATLIDIDRPDVLAERLKRLKRGNIAIPPNLISIAANLAEVKLDDVLEDYQTIDVFQITSAYFTHEQLELTARYIRTLLSDDGLWLGYMPWQPGITEVRAATRIFKKHVGDYPAVVDNIQDIEGIFSRAGYKTVQAIFPSQIAPGLGIPEPILNMEVLVAAKP